MGRGVQESSKNMSENRASDSSFSSNELLDHRIFQAPVDLRRSLIKPLLQSRTSCKTGPGCSGLLSNWASKNSKTSSLFPCSTLLTDEKRSLISSLIFLFQLAPIAPHSPIKHHSEKTGSTFLITLFYGVRGLPLGPHKILFPGSTNTQCLQPLFLQSQCFFNIWVAFYWTCSSSSPQLWIPHP